MRRSFARLHYKADYRDSIGRKLEFPSAASGVMKNGSVTIVMAAYMRAETMKISIESVLGQTFANWKLIIVGDGTCSESKIVADSFRDKRISFINLPRNFGDQSLPNSIGSRLCDTEFLAFLSQDDIWYPDHLRRAISFLDQKNGDFFLSAFQRVKPINNKNDKFSSDDRFLTGKESYSPGHDWDFVASTWVLRSEIAKRVGDWKSAREVRYSSSQEYLFRCWASGARILVSPHPPSVLIVPSIHIKNPYSTDSSRIHRNLLDKILSQDKISQTSPVVACNSISPSKIKAVHLGWQGDTNRSMFWKFWVKSAFVIFQATVLLVARLGMPPWEYCTALLGVKKGFHKTLLDGKRGL